VTIHQKYRFPFASYPAVRLILLMATGIAIDYHFNPDTFAWSIVFGTLICGYVCGEIIYQKSLKSQPYNLALICFLGMVLSFGGLWHSYFDYRQVPTEAQVINRYTWEELKFQGSIQQVKQTSTGKYQIDIEVDTTIFPGGLNWAEPYKLRAVLNPAGLEVPQDLRIGNTINFLATVYPLEEKRNPSQFDYKQYLASQGIYSQVGIQRIIRITPVNQILSWTFWRKHILKAIDNNFRKETAPLAKALLIGYKNELGREEKITFSRAGLSHIMAVSGLHVGFILAPFWIMIPLFWTMKYGKHIGLALLIGTLFFYAGLTGFSASVTRASLVGIFLAYGKLFHKVRDSKNLTAVAALLILLINPSDLFSIGFQLSFGAVYIILLTAPVIQRWLPNWIRFRWYGAPAMVVVISFLVQIGLFPLLAYYFGEFSIIGPLANAFVVPFLGFAVPYALVLLLVAMPFPGFAHLMNTPVDFFLNKLGWFVNATANLPWSWVQVHVDSILFFSIWITAIFFISTLYIPKMRWKLLAILLGVCCLYQGSKLTHKLQPPKLKLTFFDVGQGDATLVSTPNDKHFLIDTGRWQPDYNSAKYVIIPHLKEESIEKLDAVFLSHPHADHIGGILELMDTMPIDTIFNSGVSYDSQLYRTYHRKAAEKDIPIKSLNAGEKVSIDPAIRMFVYGPMSTITASNVNNQSLILELVYGQTEFLFMGDAEKPQEENILHNYPALIDTDFIKVPHHGSKTSSSSGLLKAITAQSGIISLAKQNRFTHPHKEAVKRLRRHISNLHFTSLQGAIQFISDGETIHQQF
jgi:competence protein ComEC